MRVAAAFIEALSRLRYTYFRFHDTVAGKFVIPHVLSLEPCSIDTALSRLNPSVHGAIDPIEGAMWRVESKGNKGNVEFLAKYVRHDKVDGRYLPKVSGQPEVWNWRPE